MSFISQVMLVGVPLSYLVAENAQATYFIRCVITFTVSMSILCLIFIPKIYIHYTNPHGSNSSERSSAFLTGLKLKRSQSFFASQSFKWSKRNSLSPDILTNLERCLTEEGIDAKSFLRRIGIDDGLSRQSQTPFVGNPRVGERLGTQVMDDFESSAR